MIAELRWPGDPLPDTGIDIRSLEFEPGELAVVDILRRPDVMANLARWNAGSALGEGTRRACGGKLCASRDFGTRRIACRLCARRIGR